MRDVIEQLQQALRLLLAHSDLTVLREQTDQRRDRLRRRPGGSRVVQNLEVDIESGHTYGTLLVDPPWLYRNASCRGAAAHHYPGMKLKDLAALPLAALAAEDAHLWLWTTNSFLFEAGELLRAWGFEYKTNLIWIKEELGLGNYLRSSHEILLFATRGNPGFRRKDQASWVVAPRRRHSEKPEVIREMIEACSPAPRIELFARRRPPGWSVWGNQIEAPTLFDSLEEENL